MAEPSRPILLSASRGLRALVAVLALGAAPACAQSILSLLANSMNAELPRAFGNHTRLMKVSATGNTLGFQFEVAPQSPLANGIDVKAQAAQMCKNEMFRSVMKSAQAALHVSFSRPDHSPIGEFTIDRSICHL